MNDRPHVETLTGGSKIPRNWQFTPEWMTPIIAHRYPGARLSKVRLLEGSEGTSSRARFELEYSAGSGPQAVFAKTQGDWLHRLLHVMTGNLYQEGLLYGSGLQLPLEYPKPVYGAVDRLRLNYLAIMEDLGPRGVVLKDATKPVTVDDVASGLRGLARMHSAFWNFSSRTHPELGWVKPWKVSWTFQLTLRQTCGIGISNLKDSLPDAVAALGAKGMEQWWSRYIRTVSRGPTTFLHGDPHVGNTYLVPDGELGFLDWACCRRGNWAFDVGYFIVSALDVADCRAHEADLVEEYRRELDVPPEDRPTREQAWLRYRTTPAYGLAVWVATGSSVNYQSSEICANLVHRYGSAFVDLDTPTALSNLEDTL